MWNLKPDFEKKKKPWEKDENVLECSKLAVAAPCKNVSYSTTAGGSRCVFHHRAKFYLFAAGMKVAFSRCGWASVRKRPAFYSCVSFLLPVKVHPTRVDFRIWILPASIVPKQKWAITLWMAFYVILALKRKLLLVRVECFVSCGMCLLHPSGMINATHVLLLNCDFRLRTSSSLQPRWMGLLVLLAEGTRGLSGERKTGNFLSAFRTSLEPLKFSAHQSKATCWGSSRRHGVVASGAYR